MFTFFTSVQHIFFLLYFIYKKINRMYKKEIKKARAEVTPK